MHPLSAAHISPELIFDLDEQLQRASCCAVHVVAGPFGPALIGIAWPNPQLPPNPPPSPQIPPVTPLGALITPQIPPTTPDHLQLPPGSAGGNNLQIPPIPLIHPQLESFLHAERLAARVNALAGTGDFERAEIVRALAEAAH